MRRIIALFLALMLLLGCALAEADAAPAETDAALPQVGDQISGFTVAGVYPYDSMAAQAVEFSHDKTGAKLIWIANDSTDRAFSVGFRTHVTNDKGIPHVFEHAVLSGSEKYPNPNLFMSAVFGTYNTFMNGYTYSTYTCYPCSSLSEAQLLRYVDFYLDGVYHPLVVSDERSMLREAYRYELPSADAELTLQGTVYSEMLGALTQDSDAYYHSLRATFPGSAVGSITGGVPGVIETMSQQDLIDFHSTYYQPSNSLMVLYGDLDIAPFLELIDGEYLSAYERVEVDLSEPDYAPISGDVVEHITFPVGAQDEAQTYMIYTIPLPGVDLLELNQLAFAMEAMAVNGQPFDNLVKQRLPGVAISPGCNTEGPCLSVYFYVIGASPEQEEEVVSVIREGIAQTIEQGLDRDLLSSSVLTERMTQAMLADNQSAVDGAVKVMQYWGYQGDPTAFLMEDTFRGNLQRYLDEGAFDAVLKKDLSAPDAASLVVSTGEPGGKERQDAARKQALAEKKDAMSEAEIEALVEQSQALSQWNAENEASVSVAPLMAVDVQTLPEEVTVHEAKDEVIDGLRIVSSPVDSDMMRIDIYLDATGVPADKLDEATAAVSLLGMLSTENYDATTLTSRVAVTTGNVLTELTDIRQEDWSYAPYLHISFPCFPESLDEAFALIEEMLLRTKFTPEEVQAICGFYAPALKSSYDPSNYAINLACAAFSEAVAYEERTTGSGMIRALERIADMDGEELASFTQGMGEVMDILCDRNGMILTVASSEENISAVIECTRALREKLGDAAHESEDYSEALAVPAHIAATYGSDAMYNAAMLPFRETGLEWSGKLRAFSAAVQSAVLMPVMRNMYSVYSPSLLLNRDWVGILAYRDPRLAETYNEVLPALSGYVRELKLTQEELDGYITSAYSTLAAPVGPFTGAATAIEDALCGRDSFERKATQMRELKQTTPEDIAAYAGIFDVLAEKASRAAVGSPQLIEGASELFDEVDTWLTE